MWMVVWVVLLSLLILWLVVHLLGWAVSFGADKCPFNWRVFLGPWSYERWLESSQLDIDPDR